MAADEKLQALYGGFKRLRDFPLDPSSIFDTLEELEGYISKSHTTAYAGQVAVVLGETGRGIYYIIDKSTDASEKQLGIIKSMDIADEEELFNKFDTLRSDMSAFAESMNTSFDDLTENIRANYITREQFDKVTNLDTKNIEGVLDSLGEVILVLENINNAITSSASFRIMDTQIKKIRKLLPQDLNDSISIEDFNPAESQILATKGDIDELRETTRSIEKVISFEFGDEMENESPVIGSDNGFVITEIRVDIKTKSFDENNLVFNLRIDRSHEVLLTKEDLSFSEPATFIFFKEIPSIQKSKLILYENVFGDASGTIMVKYFEK